MKAIRCRENVPLIARMLEEESVPITWATVGHLFLESCERSSCGLAHGDMPRPPKNERWEGDWYKHDPCTSLARDPAWYAPDLIRAILASRVKHEMGSHSFSHIDFSAPTSTPELVRREMEECIKVMKSWGLRLRSLVYPFNNMGHHYLDLLADLNITSVRHRDARVRLSYPERSPWGVYKFYETLNLWTGTCYDYADKAKIFLAEAMKGNAAYHLWFHPSDPTEIFENHFRKILRHVRALSDQGKLWPATMGELAAYCEARQKIKLDVQRNPGSIRIRFDSSYDVARYGETEITVRLPVSRRPSKCLLRFDHEEKLIEGYPDANGTSPDEGFLFNVPVKAKEMEVDL